MINFKKDRTVEMCWVWYAPRRTGQLECAGCGIQKWVCWTCIKSGTMGQRNIRYGTHEERQNGLGMLHSNGSVMGVVCIKKE
jgi:hypothetical protein